MKLFPSAFLISILASVLLNSCSVYKSPQRKDFESESGNFKVQNLKQLACSETSIKAQASTSRLVTVLQSESKSESQFIWEYIIDDQSYFESDNSKGEYCAFKST
ncbi:MAG: hypothetical protein H7256_03165 [Bdellovibrio sp.]|nr:hypothetical protein [Bdellovibrio sp.]